MEDWKAMYDVFKEEEFQFKSDQASRARNSQVLKHSNDPTNFSQSMHSRALNGEPTDSITMFGVADKKSTDPTCEAIKALNGEPTDSITMFGVADKKSTDPTCEAIKGKMKAMKEQRGRGELGMSLEDINHAFSSAGMCCRFSYCIAVLCLGLIVQACKLEGQVHENDLDYPFF